MTLVITTLPHLLLFDLLPLLGDFESWKRQTRRITPPFEHDSSGPIDNPT